jgi:replicative DNA helicase
MAKTEPAVGSTRPNGPRTPPHNLQAEESLLGAMLLARDAIAAAAEIVRPEHFYKPAHVHIYDAILGLYGSGEPVDPITVADELARAGLLDTVGGPGSLVGLQANAPAISNAGRYARIIEELSLLRGMIGVAGEIAELGYSMPEDVAKAVDSAEAMVFDLAQHRQAGTTATIRQLLEQSLDRLEQLYERGEAITGTPTGYLDLDDLLSGLQPNALVVVGARPAMGKALALDTPVPTPSGWTTMGALRAGDVVLDERGHTCTVTYATPAMPGRPCYRVTFDDDTDLVADGDHRWLAYERPVGDDTPPPFRLPRVVTTTDMVDAEERDGHTRPRWFVPVAAALVLPDADLPIEPYRLGLTLGSAASPSADREIPACYLRASVDQRVALLAGLLEGCRSRSEAAELLAAGGRASGDPAAGAGPEGARRPRGATHLPATEQHCRTLRFPDRRVAAQARELVCSLGHAPGPLQPRHAPPDAPAWWFTWTAPDRAASARFAGRPLRAVRSIRPTRSVPVRCIAVDSPNRLYLAGESMVPTHNTSFALGMASHAALVGQRPVLFFSLEMSKIEITQRLLCSEARVDATRVRNGRLNEGDWEKISHTVGRLADAPMWIDDNPNLTVMEIRSKARKLKSQIGDLGLVVVDYIQLMTGRSAAESRQVEVAEISRGLKILAREIETPVVALAQLNRGLEQRADKRPMLSDLRESGCLPAATRILLADGDEVPLGDLVRAGEQPLVWSVDRDGQLVPARLLKAFASGTKPVYRLRLASGRSVEATANHPFLTQTGWCRLDHLGPGTPVAVPRHVPLPVGRRAPAPGGADPTASPPAGPRSRDDLRASGDLSWDPVTSIEPVGEQPTFDATIEGTHNFVADGIVVHNSLEQDADVVLFLYRDEVYNRESPDQGIAEVIVAKHRSGPTGAVRLAFLGQYTKFVNMARS